MTLCRLCKWGHCVTHEVEGVVPGPLASSEPDFGNEFSEFDEDEEMSPFKIVKEEQNISLCFWRPDGEVAKSPSVFSEVKECTRYECERPDPEDCDDPELQD